MESWDQMVKVKKTNVMRVLEQHNVPYDEHHYFGNDVASGVDVAQKIGVNPNQQFKTLVTVAKSKEHYVFVIPVNNELDLKKAAQAVDEKNISMIKEKELLPLTGYRHGGCSPIGMKKEFKTTIHETALEQDTIIFSAGKVGVMVEVAPDKLKEVLEVQFADLVKE